MHVKVGSFQAVELELIMPLKGAWSATASIDGSVCLSGSTSITIGDVTFAGTATASDVWGSRANVRIVGGAGALGQTIEGKFYRQSTTAQIVSDILTGIGESVSTTVDSGVSGFLWPYWARSRGAAQKELEMLFQEQAISAWRLLKDGTFWYGTDTWPTCSAKFEFLNTDASAKQLELVADSPAIFPGQTFDDLRIVSVTHRLGDGGLRTTVEYQ